jgi:hypothetical protein
MSYQLVGDDGGTRFGVLKAEVAHSQTSWFGGGDQPIALHRRQQNRLLGE